jgi:hypothetical protein
MSKQRQDPKDSQRQRVLEYVKALQERGETYRGRTAAEHFDAQENFWTMDQLQRFVLEGKIGYLREIVNSIPPERGKEEVEVEPVYSVVRQTTDGADHTYEPKKKLNRQDWYTKITDALNVGITYKAKAKDLLETAKTELPGKDFTWLTKQLSENPQYQLLLDMDQSERSTLHTSRKKRASEG